MTDTKKSLKHGLYRRMTSVYIETVNAGSSRNKIIKIAYLINLTFKGNAITFSSGGDIGENLARLFI